jgi:hypothetical protein
MICVLTNISYDCSLLPHFVLYYRGIGVERFIVAINEQVPGIFNEAQKLAHDLGGDINIVAASDREKSSGVEANNKEEIRLNHCNAEDWVIPADLDEFVQFPCPLIELITELERANATFIMGDFSDRIAKSGRLEPICEKPSLWKQYPLQCSFSEELVGCWCHKVALCRGDCKLASGHHSVTEPCRPLITRRCVIHHFKWREGLLAALKRRVDTYKRAGVLCYPESERVLRYFAQYNRIVPERFGAHLGWDPDKVPYALNVVNRLRGQGDENKLAFNQSQVKTNAISDSISRLTSEYCTAVWFVATGPISCIERCIHAIHSLKCLGKYSGPIFVFTDEEDYRLEIDNVFLHITPRCDGEFDSRRWKTNIDNFSPFEYNLYLDCDTLVVGDIQPVFDSLKEADVLLTIDVLPTLFDAIKRGRFSEVDKLWTKQQVPLASAHYNAGVIAWRKGLGSCELFREWHKEWLRYQDRDQLALVRAICTTKIKIMPLPERFNMASERYSTIAQAMDQGVVILHFWDRRSRLGNFSTNQLRYLLQAALPQTPENVEIREILTRHVYLYERVGHDKRAIRFLSDGRIGIGSGGCERYWSVWKGQEKWSLDIFGSDKLTCSLTADEEGAWKGAWNIFEGMPIVLSILPAALHHPSKDAR